MTTLGYITLWFNMAYYILKSGSSSYLIILNEIIEYQLIKPEFLEFTVEEVHFSDEVFQVLLPLKIEVEKERKEGLVVFWNEVDDLNKESEMERVNKEFYEVQDWNQDKPDQIDCRRCGNGLKENLEKIEKYLGLPSEGWEGFVEYWICHEMDNHGGYIFVGKKTRGDQKQDVCSEDTSSSDDLILKGKKGFQREQVVQNNSPSPGNLTLNYCDEQHEPSPSKKAHQVIVLAQFSLLALDCGANITLDINRVLINLWMMVEPMRDILSPDYYVFMNVAAHN
ncbi:uncharacterized protein MELLADRAFT_105449 [Melampsora larici-populina 98AG31]|uniref:Uncharacterized protein n=1 Tax=Melampsora larici-populina (strain 98AG31 / pathotype 3-4-7) TaxID=747676 RepID=F4RI60_MELLP|nr:uncharacterized protein MELLADRAFT_105449 [Melampsora larici-populina 98AG31]EGG08016.1 hypothetical protein MELLADRAFT_105449 [Melampsora larici-populina 98AG31]